VSDDSLSRHARRLRDDEVALWTEVARTVAPRPGANLPRIALPPSATPAKSEAEPQAPAPPRTPRETPPLAPLERRLKRDLHRGRAGVDDAIDLHGYTQEAAHAALVGFLKQAQRRGAKVVIVVTGTGAGKLRHRAHPWFDEPGVLRRSAPYWLRAPDLRPIVLGFEEAGPAHGGAGALYVRLRRPERR